jgi:hypothetical protein
MVTLAEGISVYNEGLCSFFFFFFFFYVASARFQAEASPLSDFRER